LGLARGERIARMLSNRVLVFLGEASFSLYLLQGPVFCRLQRWFGPELTPGHLAVSLVVLVIASAAMFRWIETPLRRRIVRLLSADVRLAASPSSFISSLSVS
jgi:peptidoglycan/LPS O-acetylase OafA/YrhL